MSAIKVDNPVEIMLPFDRAQEIAQHIDDLGILVRYRVLERRIATRQSPGCLKSVMLSPEDFITTPLSGLTHSDRGVWVTFWNDEDYILFKLRCMGIFDFLTLDTPCCTGVL